MLDQITSRLRAETDGNRLRNSITVQRIQQCSGSRHGGPHACMPPCTSSEPPPLEKPEFQHDHSSASKRKAEKNSTPS